MCHLLLPAPTSCPRAAQPAAGGWASPWGSSSWPGPRPSCPGARPGRPWPGSPGGSWPWPPPRPVSCTPAPCGSASRTGSPATGPSPGGWQAGQTSWGGVQPGYRHLLGLPWRTVAAQIIFTALTTQLRQFFNNLHLPNFKLQKHFKQVFCCFGTPCNVRATVFLILN